MLHEMTHNMGAVQWGAPHSTEPPGQSLPQYGHCWQGADVMCYTEDSGAAHPMRTDCAALPGAIPESYDCGRDDYFNPAPAAGSYLATHWNTYDSAFLAGCGEVAPACGGGSLWVPEPPAATTAPTVAGTPRRGQLLTARVGVWTNSPTGYTYQWQRLVASGWEDIDSATAGTYKVTGEDLGRRLRVAIVATNQDGSASAASGPSATIGASGLNRAASSTSAKGKKKAAVKAKASKKKKAARKRAAAKKTKRAAAKKKAKSIRR